MEKELLYGTGAIKDKVDKRDIQYSHIAMGTVPFDWNKGYDVEEELRLIVGDPAFRIASKDQDGSSSCGGQAWAYYGAVLECIATGTYEERSAKFIYAQTHAPGGGSGGRENCQLVINQGWARENVCSSYDKGMAPSEAFMTRAGDITAEARKDASGAKGLLFANVATNIDLFAQAARDNYGLIGGVYGANNGTWLSPYPKPPASNVPGNQYWAHWLYIGKARIINGKKMVAVKNSWGEDVGEKGWQWLGEEYFKYTPQGLDHFIWSGWTMVFKGSDPAFHHTFTESLKRGSKGQEVSALQKALALEGMFKGEADGKFGKITESSVKAFQARYSLLVDGKVGPKTNAKLNQLYK